MSVLGAMDSQDPPNIDQANALHAVSQARLSAVQTLATELSRAPSNKALLASLGDARYAALLETTDGWEANESVPAPPPATQAAMADILQNCEPLGSGCEFGLLQRHYGVETMGLFRWAHIPPRGLAILLETRFEGLDDAAHIEVFAPGRTYLMHARYGYATNTYIKTDSETVETLLPKLSARLRYLTRKLLSSLNGGDKLFVYKAHDGILDVDLLRIFCAIRSYGQNTLLVVKLDPSLAGRLDVLEPGLLCGYLDRFSNADISRDLWSKLLTVAYAYWQSKEVTMDSNAPNGINPVTALIAQAVGLRQRGDVAALEAMLPAALAAHPGNRDLLSLHSWAAMMRQDWPAAIERAQLALPPPPPNREIAAAFGYALVYAKHVTLAEAFIESAIATLPPGPGLLCVHAICANRRGDWAESYRRWLAAREKFPGNPQILGGLAEAAMGIDQAVAIGALDELLILRPADAAGAILRARLDQKAGRYTDALQRLENALLHAPQNKALLSSLADARYAAMLDAPEREAAPAAVPARPPAAQASMADILHAFESLGTGCEFGLLQRHFGVETLGLLRWAAIAPRGLCALLEARFAGIADPAHTRVNASGPTYMLHHDGYGYGSNTYIATNAEPAETLLPKLRARLSYLSRKLTGSLSGGDKIFVYKAQDGISDQDTQRLFQALRSYGNNTLLIAKLNPEAAGRLDVLQPGLMCGYLDRFSNSDFNIDLWSKLCTEAYAHRQDMQG